MALTCELLDVFFYGILIHDMNTTDNFTKHTSKNPLQRFFIQKFNEKLLKVASDLPIESVLDVGCGEGFTLQKLTDHHIGKKLEGIEYDETAIALGKKVHPNITIKQGDIYKLPYKDNSFDLVICTEVLEHLEDTKKALNELYRVTKKYCLLSVPHEPIFMLVDYARGKTPQSIGHINHWSRGGFSRFVETKFKVKNIYNPFPWTMILAEKV